MVLERHLSDLGDGRKTQIGKLRHQFGISFLIEFRWKAGLFSVLETL